MEPHPWNPENLLALSGSYWQTCTLHAAVKVDLFTLIGREQLSRKQIAERLNADLRGLSMLADALVAMGLLEKSGNTYANTAAARSFLCKDAPRYIGHMIMHHHHLVQSWAQLDQVVKSGRPVRSRASAVSAQWRESFLMGMFNMAMNLAPRLVEAIDISGRKHMLDLGGGPGTYAIHFCLKHPQLRATIFDLPTTRPFAMETIDKFGLKDRIDFVEGNYLEDAIKGSYDVAWLSHILHGEGPDDCRRIIHKAVSALQPGGQVIIHDFILNDSMDGPLFPALFALNMLLGTPAGQSYAEKQIMEMLEDAKAGDIRRIPVRTPNDSGIITGIKDDRMI